MIYKKNVPPVIAPCVWSIVELIKTHFQPDKIILFGPYFSGTISRKSEVNLLVIKDSFLPKGERAKEIEILLSDNSTPVDILVYTPIELEIALKNKYGFINTVLMVSYTMYDKELCTEKEKATSILQH